ncbi:cupin domain-containing protein [Deinococcus oregonensis]|uniref:Cupin domain-containing protein n=1 Tax=Deinococcus oregonensis TaxID=1805970 RepID=A0ABV6AU14_9DEIO
MIHFPPTFDLRADRFWVLVSGKTVDGQYAVVETLAHQGFELPVHVHQSEDELLVVLSGRVCVWIGLEERQLVAGETLRLARGVPHAVRLETTTARLLTIYRPGGFEHYLEAVAQPVLPFQPLPDPQAVGPPDVPLLVMTAQRYGLEYFPELPGSTVSAHGNAQED